MLAFCLITGENYLAKSLVLYDSLLENCSKFHLYYFCYDDSTFETLTTLKEKGELKFVTAIKNQDYINSELIHIKNTRQLNEFYWTLTPYITKYCIDNFPINNITYIDSDLYFYKDPSILFNELGEKEVLITRHNYSKEFQHLNYAGEFCVQFNTFLKKKNSIEILDKWKNQCLEWCYHKYENGKFGDQGYLNEWPKIYPNVHIIENEGGGIAPWNINKYEIEINNGSIGLHNKDTKEKISMVFYHFQSIRLYFNAFYYFGGYNLKRNVTSALYIPYLKKIHKKKKYLTDFNSKLDPLGNINNVTSLFNLIRILLRRKAIIQF